MNLSKYLILGLLVGNCFASEHKIVFIESILSENGKYIEKAKTTLDILKATRGYTETVSNIKRVYLDLP
jgi:hypothetical protein